MNKTEQTDEMWANDIPMTEREKVIVGILRKAGCKCQWPLDGWIPQQGPRCRMCGVEAIHDEIPG